MSSGQTPDASDLEQEVMELQERVRGVARQACRLRSVAADCAGRSVQAVVREEAERRHELRRAECRAKYYLVGAVQVDRRLGHYARLQLLHECAVLLRREAVWRGGLVQEEATAVGHLRVQWAREVRSACAVEGGRGACGSTALAHGPALDRPWLQEVC